MTSYYYCNNEGATTPTNTTETSKNSTPMKITNRKISELKSAEYNPRYITEHDFKHLTRSLEKFGVVDPAVINANKDRKDTIIGGHQRIEAARRLGWDEFPCVMVDLTYEKERELNIRLNKNTGKFDYDILANLYDADELKDYGFTDAELGMNISFFGDDDSDDDGKDDDEPAKRSKADDTFSAFEIIMIHENKKRLIDFLDQVKRIYQLDKMEDALMKTISLANKSIEK